MRVLKWSAGRFVRGKIRDLLTKEKFMGTKIEWVEIKGVLESEFLIKGADDIVSEIESSLNKWHST